MKKVLLLVFIYGFLSNPFKINNGLAEDDKATLMRADQAPLNSEGIVSGPFYPADTRGLPPAPPAVPESLDPFELQFEQPADHPGTLPIPKPGIALSAPEPADNQEQVPFPAGSMPDPLTNWEGISSAGVGSGVLPPDTDGQVGPNHYVQIINHGTTGAWVRVWDKSGTEMYNFGMNALWPPGDPCYVKALGDPVVLYDQEFDRWLLTQFTSGPAPYYECIAVSKGSNPTNLPADWYPYSMLVHNSYFPDYPKFGVWPDGYYMMAHQFLNNLWQGTGIWVFDKSEMLAGLPATFQYINLFPYNPLYSGMLPSNWMGSNPPPGNSPNYFIEVEQDWSGSNDILTVFEAQANWPNGFTFTVADELAVDTFSWPVCSATRGRCIHQPEGAPQLEALSDRLMMHAWYRNFGSYEVIVANHTVNTGGNRAGIRWYEIRKNSGNANWYVHQQGTYAPDSDHRWMGSIAMDKSGNIALGYSVSSESVYPSIRYTGRLSSDPAGSMPQGEGTIVNGSGVQLHTSPRWGDYSAMSVDPNDDCTFWYTQEYMQTTSTSSWRTRVASFKFPNCFAGPSGRISGTVTDASNGNPIYGSEIQTTSEGSGTVFTTVTDTDGTYSIQVPVDTYSVDASEFGYYPESVTGTAVTDGSHVIQDFALNPSPMVTLSGIVHDAATNWPLYAQVEISNAPVEPAWSDPVSGYYEFQLPDGVEYDLKTRAFVQGYLPNEVSISLSKNTTQNIGLEADLTACKAPGYEPSPCTAQAGGLVVGNVYDENTAIPLSGAQVSNEDSYSTISVETPQDDDVDDGFYTLFSPTGNNAFSSTKSGGYGTDNQNVEVLTGNTVGLDFNLAAGLLSSNPAELEITVMQGLSNTQTIDLNNLGALAAQFSLVELENEYTPSGPYQNPQNIVKRHKQNRDTSEELELPPAPAANPLSAGNVISTWDPEIPGPWGIVFDKNSDSVWVSSPHANWSGDDHIYEFDTTGVPTGSSHAHDLPHIYGPGDAALNWSTGKIWIMNINSGTANCIYEIDPTTGYTGSSICPGGGSGFPISQRGLAYDPTTDTFYAGGWNDLSIHHFATDGTMLSSIDVGLAVSGLAFNPETRHLFAMVNADPNSIYVLDADDNFNILGQFNVSQDFGAYSGAGMEFDCRGKLWAVDQAVDKVLQIESGESVGEMCNYDVPWLSESPEDGSINPQESDQIKLILRADVPEADQPGDYTARLKVQHDTPYGPMYIPVTMTVIASAYGVMIQPDSAGSGFPGSEVLYSLQVTNKSNTQDSFEVNISGNDWNTTGPVDLGNLLPDETIEIEIIVVIPLAVFSGDEDTATITVVSKSDQSKRGSAVLNTSVEGFTTIFPLIYN